MSALKLDELAQRCGEWLRGQGPQSEIVISSRIRLARNLASFPFIRRCSESDRIGVEKTFRDAIASVPEWKELSRVNVADLVAIDRQFLVERQLISRELSEASGARSVFIDSQETYSLMINEEDHLRMQVMHSGLDLEAAWQQINQMDDWLDERVNFAFHERLGYLTACPTNVGTGMRVSVMLHLPALVITQQIEKVFRSLQKMGLAVRGLYGEGSQAMGDFYQISNQITLGRSETDLIKQVAEVIPVIIDYEQQARAFLVKESRNDLKDRVSRAYGILCTAQTISSEETLHLLSSVRMGIYLGLIKDLEIPTINKLFIHTQPAHLQKLRGVNLDTAERNVERAHFLQSHLRPRQNGGALGQN
jgi:protein arginine kinase